MLRVLVILGFFLMALMSPSAVFADDPEQETSLPGCRVLDAVRIHPCWRADAWIPVMEAIPRRHLEVVRVIYVDREYDGWSDWPYVDIHVPKTRSTQNDITWWHEIGHVIMLNGEKLNAGALQKRWTERFWPAGWNVYPTNEPTWGGDSIWSYARTDSWEDAAESYAGMIVRTLDNCCTARFNWMRSNVPYFTNWPSS
jgi:hypothetical protein